MPKAGEKTMRELEEILNESETYADRLAAFLKQKTAPPKSQCNEPFALDDLDLTFDLDVALVKLPAKPVLSAINKAEESKEHALREITNQPVLAEDSKALESQTVPNSQEHAKSRASPVHITSPSQVNTSPRRSIVRRSGHHVPSSDRLRRVAIHRRSRSCGRRDLLKEFNDLSTCNDDFRPPLNSTPDSEKKPSEKTTQTTDNASEPECVKTSAPAPTAKKDLPPDDLLSQASSMQLHSVTSDASTKRRTYTIEMGPEPGQLLLSPSNKGNPYSLRQRLSPRSPSNSERTRHQAELSAARLQILAQDTPIRPYSPIQPIPDFIVPETQPVSQLQPGNQMIQHFAGNAVVAPLMVVPMASVLSLNTKPDSTPTRPTQVEAAAQVKLTAAPRLTNRSMQTSNSLRCVQDVNDIMTDDDSSDEKQVSTAPLNLAPPSGNISRKRNLRIRVKRVDNSTELLDLHRSCYKTSQKRNKTKQRQTVLNKPSQPAINGEQFAYELARMSNYEILDLRKRKSMGRQCPINGHREQPTEQELLLEKHIEWEILRRNLDEPNERTATTIPINETTIFESSLAAPPQDYRDVSMTIRREDSKTTQQRRSRPSRRDSVMMRSLSPPLPPPSAFGNSSQKTRQQRKTSEQKSIQRLRSRQYEPTMGEDDILAVCTPPSQFRKSMSRQQKIHSPHQQEDHTLPDEILSVCTPPSQFRKSMSRQQKNHSQQQQKDHTLPVPPPEINNMHVTESEEEIQLLPPAQFFDELEEIDSSVKCRPASQLPTLQQIETDHAQMSYRQRIEEEERLEDEIGKNDLEARQQKEVQEKQKEENTQKERSMQKGRGKQNQSKKQHQEKNSISSQQQEQCSHEKNQRKSQQQELQKSQQHLQLEGGPEKSLHERDLQKKINNQGNSQQQEIRQQEESMREEEQSDEEKNQSNNRKPQRKSQQQERQRDGHQQQLQGGKQKESISEKEQLDQEKEQQKKGKKQRKSHKLEKRQQEKSMLEHQRSDSTHEPEQEAPPPAPSDHIFKKPTAPAPRAKQKTQLERQLQKLHINLANKTLVPEDVVPEDTNTTVRRSRRGQVPLCNTWVHTQTDPFNFMRKIVEPKATTSKRNKRAESTASGSSVKNKGPLSSSTPRTTPAQNGKRKRPPQNKHQENGLCDIDALSGISRLSDISEGEEMETPRNHKGNLQLPEKSSDAGEESKKSKRGKKKKEASIAVPETSATEADSADDFPTAAPNSIEPEQQPSETLLAWLCGEREVPTDGNDLTELRNEAMTVSRASNLKFSNVDGIEYAFYQTEDLYSMGYMRFQPLQQRGMKLARTNTLRFVTLHGQFDVTILNQQTNQKYEGILSTGDVIEVKKGNRYNISNRLNRVGIIMVYRNAE